MVGTNAYLNKRIGEIPFSKCFFRIDTPTGLGELAIIVKPPPASAPAINEYLSPSEKSGTKVAKYVSAALSLKAVNAIEAILMLKLGKLARIGLIHQACKVP